MSTTRIIRIMAGFVVLLSLGLGVEASPIFVNINWLWLTAFAGFNLFQSGITGFCLPELVLKKFGKDCESCS
ncbi:MAG TPA: DUF2892 domain-containing protein [Gammaproteobacteria bacterium]|nr:DUF2892 domain-containing protein [Gammaproteobacteria bacterium]